MSPLNDWVARIKHIDGATVLDTGVKPWGGSPPNDHQQYAPNAKWLGTDIDAGDGVDIIADLHCISGMVSQRFDGIFSASTLEHVQRPWIVVKQLAAMMNEGGVLFIQTHQTFPIHGYPSDYFRFTTEALAVLCVDAGLIVSTAGYEFPTTITPPAEITRWNASAESFLNVSICAIKP